MGSSRLVHGADTLVAVCSRTPQDDAIDVIPVAFINDFFGTGGAPVLNLANVSLMFPLAWPPTRGRSRLMGRHRFVTRRITQPSREQRSSTALL